MKLFILASAAALLAVTAAQAHDHHETFAAGTPGTPAKPAREISISIVEKPDGTMVFSPASLDAKLGDQVPFTVTNTGRAPHEFRLDSRSGNAAHKAMMVEMPGMVHHDANSVTIAPGATAEVLWRFSKPGTFEYACLIPGHYAAGMHGRVIVAQ